MQERGEKEEASEHVEGGRDATVQGLLSARGTREQPKNRGQRSSEVHCLEGKKRRGKVLGGEAGAPRAASERETRNEKMIGKNEERARRKGAQDGKR